jgi:hypothetical protein
MRKRTHKEAHIAPMDESWSQCGLAGRRRTIEMEPLEMEGRNRFHVRNEAKRLDRRRSQLRYTRLRDPLESIVVEALSVLDLQTRINDCLAWKNLREGGRGNTN